MANSATHLDLIEASQAQHEVTANGLFDAFSPGGAFGRRASTSFGLTWGYFGGTILPGGVPTQIANGTIVLTASATNYLKASSAGVVSATTSPPSGWPGPLSSGSVALYEVVTGSAGATSWTDLRGWWGTAGAVGPEGPTGPAGSTGPEGPPGEGGSANATWAFGAGTHGSATLDGSATVTWASKVGSVYTITEAPALVDLTVNSGITLITNNFQILVSGTLTNNGTIKNDGNAPVSQSTGGSAITGTFFYGQSGVGGNSTQTTAPASPSDLTDACGGSGGAGGTAAAGAGAAGASTIPPTAGIAYITSIIGLLLASQAHFLTTWKSGAGGGGARGSAGFYGGAAGGGGGTLVIAARLMAGNGSITAKGGPGDNADPSSVNGGGGGGGGGGVIGVITTTSNWQSLYTVSVDGGVPGTGTGTGTSGTAGSSGRIISYIL